ncbi:MAG: shikimate kinase [Bacteroidales bacterium]|nr:shikimate kinase [Bacteroidales bacterium]MDT8374887.1 shikimate kinase [Bacteroidales bacterium]
MGSGKSTAGKRIASLLRWTFADIDKLVEEREGESVSGIFAHRGEAYFREAESATLRAVSERSRTVVACGGGTPCSQENMEVMASTGVTVWLRLPVKEITERLRRSNNVRPLLSGTRGGELDARVAQMLESRECWYKKADLVIDAVNDTIEDITVKVAALVRERRGYL